MLSHHKESFDALADPVAQLLLKAHVRPNHLTMAGFGVSVLAAHALASGRLRSGAALLALAGLFDFFDGALARAAQRVTPFGAFLDSVVDRYSDMVALFGVLFLYHRLGDLMGASLTMLALAGTVMVSYTKARAQSVGVDCQIGLMERPERLIVLIAGAAFGLLTPAMAVLAVFANLTALQRIWHTRRAISAPPPEPGEELASALPPVPPPEPLRTRLLYRRR
jgi:CDP-diacylglycerol--glycerol-3-phosphate 3-phosphatidyltransferase